MKLANADVYVGSDDMWESVEGFGYVWIFGFMSFAKQAMVFRR